MLYDTFVSLTILFLSSAGNSNIVWEAIMKICDQTFVDFQMLLKASSMKTCTYTQPGDMFSLANPLTRSLPVT